MSANRQTDRQTNLLLFSVAAAETGRNRRLQCPDGCVHTNAYATTHVLSVAVSTVNMHDNYGVANV